MKYFGFFTRGTVMATSMFYGYFSIFYISVVTTFFLTMSVAKPLWNEPDKKEKR